jgi:class 3 adenylate cyclase/tetratricopeptide (TPR) repeat protein
VICSSCGSENAAGRKFCKECGSSLANACRSCGAALEADAKFCGECGAPSGAGPAASGGARTTTSPGAVAAAQPIAERRLVSILFADLVGFTTLAEGKDAEDTRELLSRYFELAGDVIARYGGMVEKFIGDAVMAVWGAPTAHEDDAERAVRAGLDLVDAVRTLGPSIQARAGVLTGEAAVTIGATNQGMVAGDLVNTASRLQSVAPPGAVLVGEATHRAASKAIAFEEAGAQLLKGKTSPVPAWRALRVVAEVGGRNRSETLEAPFVGRDDELRLLKDLFHATGREGRARLVSAIGPAGIGKSRLAWEFSKYLDGVVDTVWFHVGRSPAYGDGISFWALGEMVRRRAGLLETDDEATTRSKVAATLARHVPDPEERRWIEPALLALLGIEAGAGSEQFFAAWRTFFERLAESAPVVMVFEDFHFADPGLLDFVDHLLEWSRNVPIYVVTLARPELLEKRTDWGAGKRNFTSLYLEPLTAPAMRELLAGLAPGLPEQAVRSIVSRADGIPLYAVETVRMLLAEGRLRLDGEIYVPTGDLTTLAVPETLTALIASRLDGLAAEDRALIQDAAVLGQSITLAGLAAVSGTDAVALEPRLRLLVRRELLILEADPRSPERGQYSFVQALIREVAYNTLARNDRKVRHLAAARFFETLGSDELAGVLAGQYLAAQANAPEGPERDALAAQARVALKGAAERAATLGAHDQAIALLEQALTVASDQLDQAELLERAGRSASTAARYEQLESFFRRAIEIHRARADGGALVRVMGELGRALINARRLDDALAILEPASQEFADLFPEPAMIALEGQLARAYFLHEEIGRSLELAERVLAAAEEADLLDILADTLVTKGSVLGVMGRLREGLGVIEIGERIARSEGYRSTLLRALNNRASTLSEIDFVAVTAISLEGLELAQRVGDRGAMFGYLGAHAWEVFLAGDADTALASFEGGLVDDPDPTSRLGLLSGAVAVHAIRGEDVADSMIEMEHLATMVSDPRMTAALPATRAWVTFCSGQLEEARLQSQAVALIQPDGPQPVLEQAARSALWAGDAAGAAADLAELDAKAPRAPITDLRRKGIRAGLAALAGRTNEALGLYRDTLRGWREFGLAYDAALAGIDMATLLDPADPEVQAAIDWSRATLLRMRATPLIARLESAASRGSGHPAGPTAGSVVGPAAGAQAAIEASSG